MSMNPAPLFISFGLHKWQVPPSCAQVYIGTSDYDPPADGAALIIEHLQPFHFSLNRQGPHEWRLSTWDLRKPATLSEDKGWRGSQIVSTWLEGGRLAGKSALLYNGAYTLHFHRGREEMCFFFPWAEETLVAGGRAYLRRKKEEEKDPGNVAVIRTDLFEKAIRMTENLDLSFQPGTLQGVNARNAKLLQKDFLRLLEEETYNRRAVVYPNGLVEDGPIPLPFWFHPVSGRLAGILNSNPDEISTFERRAAAADTPLHRGEIRRHPESHGVEVLYNPDEVGPQARAALENLPSLISNVLKQG